MTSIRSSLKSSTRSGRRRQWILDAATQVAADIRVDTDLLGTAAVDDSNRDDLRVLGASELSGNVVGSVAHAAAFSARKSQDPRYDRREQELP
jgi:hypothetical protein